MINEINQQKPVIANEKNIIKLPPDSAQTKKTDSVNLSAKQPLVQSTAVKTTIVKQTTSSLASAAGLPADKLSASIISFARFFSLPLKPNILAAIRRQAFLPDPPKSAASNSNANTGSVAKSGSALSANQANFSGMEKNRQALSLAAAAAESKGVTLQPKALESYAHAVDPDSQRQNEKDNQHERKNKSRNENEEKPVQKTSSINAAELEKIANDTDDPLLNILNRLPGNNGQRWIVLPFNFFENEIEYKVSMRVLLEDESRAVHMAIHIVNDNEQKWLFVFDSAKNKVNKVTAYITALDSKTKVYNSNLINDLSEILQIPAGNIIIKNFIDSFPLEADSDSENFPIINEEM